jgi:hypothetical protein
MDMKWLIPALFVSLALAALPARALEPTSQVRSSPGEVAPTPEMWFYQQYMQQYQDPKMMVRRNAEMKADQRERRLESSRWFGLSNSRPKANVDPINGDYSPGWASNNDWYPDRWVGVGATRVIVQPQSSSVR